MNIRSGVSVKSMLNALAVIQIPIILGHDISCEIRTAKPLRFQISHMERIAQVFLLTSKRWTFIIFTPQPSNFWEWCLSWIKTTLTFWSSKPSSWVFQTCGVDQRSLMSSIDPAQSFHNPQQKKGEVQTHSVFPYPCLILTYWRMISKVRNFIVSFPLVQMYYIVSNW